MQDKKIKCKVCGTEFDFTAGQQEFFASHNLSEPKKCKDCKDKEKQEKNKDKQNDTFHKVV